MKRARYPLIPLVTLAVYGSIYMTWLWGDRHVYHAILTAWGIEPARIPFLDTFGVISARECRDLGIDPYASNPCDLLGRPDIYSPLWLAGHGLADAARDTLSVGLGFDLLFLLSLWLLPRPDGIAAKLVTLAATLSTISVYALERANVDVIIFAIIAAASWLIVRGGRFRFIGYGGYLLATFLKFYPLVLVTTALRERPRPAAAIVVTTFGSAALFFFVIRRQLKLIRENFPGGSDFSDLFGAGNLPEGIAKIFWSAGVPEPASLVIVLGLFCLWIIHLMRLLRHEWIRSSVTLLSEPCRLLLSAGLLLMVGCFFASRNVDYRGIYLLLALPALIVMTRCDDFAGRRYGRMIVGIILFVTWEEPCRLGVAALAGTLPAVLGNHLVVLFRLVRELAWWWLIAAFIAILRQLFLDAPLVQNRRPSATGAGAPA